MALKECLLNELKQKEDGSGVTDYDESLYTNMKIFWDLFSTGRLTSTVTCTTCGNISTTEVPFDELLLFFPWHHHEHHQDCTLEDLIAHHCEMENIPEYECDHCNGRTLGKKVVAITTCPPILCIVLCRKKQDGGSIQSSVQFPVSGLNITEDGLQYNLVGTIHHKPSGTETGHYTSICQSLRSQSHRWFKYDDHQVSISKFTNMKNDRVLKGHTKSATILFYVSKELQTHNGQALIDIQSDASESEVNIQEGEGEDDAESTSSSESRCNNRIPEDQEREEEDDAESTSSSESECNNRITQEFLQRVQGHYCSICQEQHFLTSTDLATFETEAKCEHVYCYIRLSSRKAASANGLLTCPQCNCIASDIIHHQPIRLDDGFGYLRNTPQTLLGRCEGHQCGICFDDFNLCDTDLATMDTDVNCRHIFCFPCLSQHKASKLRRNEELKCPLCNAVSVDIIRHERRPLNEVEVVITDEPNGCCDWAMDTTSSTGIGNPHEERCICPLVLKKLRNCHHEGCNKMVHRRCQEDWLQRHCYPWTREDPHFCREHNEHYIKWVKFKGGEIPRSENGCVPGSFLNPTVENPDEEPMVP